MQPDHAFMLAAVAIAAIAAITDFRTGYIPNWLTVGGIVLGIVGRGVVGWTTGGPGNALAEAGLSLIGLMFCSIAPLVMYWKGAMGGGDLKLFAAIGALCQILLGIEAQMYAFLVAAVAAPARLAYEGRLFRVLGDSFALLLNPLRPQEKRRSIPQEAMTWFRLGPAIFAGTAATLIIHFPFLV